MFLRYMQILPRLCPLLGSYRNRIYHIFYRNSLKNLNSILYIINERFRNMWIYSSQRLCERMEDRRSKISQETHEARLETAGKLNTFMNLTFLTVIVILAVLCCNQYLIFTSWVPKPVPGT